MANIIQTIQLPDGTLQDVEVPEEWTADQIRTKLRASEFFQSNFGGADEPTTDAPTEGDAPSAAQRFSFGLLEQSGLVGEIANLAEQKLGAREPTVRQANIAINEVPPPPGAPDPTVPGEVVTRTGATEEQIRARQNADKATALTTVFPDIAGTDFADTTAADVGRVTRLMTDLITFPLPGKQQVQLAKMVQGGTKILSSKAGRAALARAGVEGGAGVAAFAGADQAIRNLSDSGGLSPDQIGTAMLIGGAGGAAVGPLLAAGGGRFARWLDERVAKGDRLTPERVITDVEATTGTQLSREQADELIASIEKTSQNTAVEREQLDNILGVKDVDKKAQKARRQQARAAFREDPAGADQLVRDAADITITNEVNAARINETPIELRQMQRRILEPAEALKRRERAALVAAQTRKELENTQARPEAEEAAAVREAAQEGTGLRVGTRIPRNKAGRIRGFWRPLNDVIGRIENLSPEMAINVRRVTQRTASESADHVNTIDRFYKSPEYKALGRKDKANLENAFKNEDLSKAHGIMAKSNGLNELYNQNIFKMLRDTQTERRAGGAEGFRASFMPRVVRSVNKLRSRMNRQQRTQLESSLARMERDLGRPLDEFELTGVYNQVLGGRPLKTDRTRRINEISLKDQKLYEDNRDALISYMHRHAENKATRDFFKGTLNEDVKLGSTVDEKAVGNLLAKSRMEGSLSDADINEMAELLGSHFGVARQGPSVRRRQFKDAFTGLTLGFNLSSTITQLGDIAPTLARMGVRGTVRGLLGPNRVGVYNVGVREAAKELSSARGLAKFVRLGLKSLGFDKLDKLAGNTAVNASLNKWFRKAEKNPASLRKELEPLYRDGTDQLVSDLADRRLSDDVKTLLLWDVGKIRPVGREDMPLSFQQNPNGRVYYSLLSWTLKQLNFLRNEAAADIAKGKVVKGTKQMIKLGLLMGLANMPGNVAKDVMAGRDVDPSQSFVEGMFSLGMSGKFIVDALNRGDGADAIASAVPVLGITGRAAANTFQSMADGDPVKFIKATPTGRALYNLWANGAVEGFGNIVIPEAGASVNHVSSKADPVQAIQPPVIRDVPQNVIKEFENPNQAGRNDGTGLWLPHESIEGGTDTLGYGHKLTPVEDKTGRIKIGGEVVDWRQGLNDQQVDQLLAQDTAQARKDVERLVKIPISPNEKEALVSLVYNIGGGALAKSQALKALNVGDRQTFVTEAFDPQRGFVKVGGRPSRGLQIRREKERQLFQTPDAFLAEAQAQLRDAVQREEETRLRPAGPEQPASRVSTEELRTQFAQPLPPTAGETLLPSGPPTLEEILESLF